MPRRITIPKTQTHQNAQDLTSPKWGLVEFLLERALPLPENYASVETCNRVLSLTEKLYPIRGERQGGKSLLLTELEYEFLSRSFMAALQQFLGQARGVVPPNLTTELANYARAVHGADVIPEHEATPLISEGGVA